MKVLLVAPMFPPLRGGDSTVAFHLAQALHEKGESVMVLAGGEPSSATSMSARLGMQVLRLPDLPEVAQLRKSPSCALDCVWEAVSEFKPDVVHVHKTGACLFGATLASALDRAMILTPHETPSESGRVLGLVTRPGLDKSLAATLIRAARPEIILCASGYFARVYRSLVDHPQRVRIVYPGIDLNLFQRRTGEFFKATMAKTKGMDARVLLPSRLVPRKGAAAAIIALRYLIDQYKLRVALLLTAAPEGSTAQVQEALLAVAAQLGVKDQVILLSGSVEYHELPELYSSVDVTVLPSEYEGLGMSLIESMACGTPVIGGANTGMLEVVDDARTGLLCDVSGPGNLAFAIQRLLTDAALAHRLATAARSSAELRFDRDRYADDCLRAYNDVV